MRGQFRVCRKLVLGGLFWSGKDIFDPELEDVMKPQARALYDIRNQLEHGISKCIR